MKKLSLKRILLEMTPRYQEEPPEEWWEGELPHIKNNLEFNKKLLDIPQSYRIHISDKPIQQNQIFKATQERRGYAGLGDKPSGLWYGFGGSWANFVQYDFPKASGNYAYVLDIDPKHILVVKSRADAEYLRETIRPNNPGGADWGALIEIGYKGIEVPNPSIASWIHDQGWDVPSGVLWDPSALRQVVPINEVDLITKKRAAQASSPSMATSGSVGDGYGARSRVK